MFPTLLPGVSSRVPLSYLLLFQVTSWAHLLGHATLGKPFILAGLTHVSGVCLLQNFWKILKAGTAPNSLYLESERLHKHSEMIDDSGS